MSQKQEKLISTKNSEKIKIFLRRLNLNENQIKQITADNSNNEKINRRSIINNFIVAFCHDFDPNRIVQYFCFSP